MYDIQEVALERYTRVCSTTPLQPAFWPEGMGWWSVRQLSGIAGPVDTVLLLHATLWHQVPSEVLGLHAVMSGVNI